MKQIQFMAVMVILAGCGTAPQSVPPATESPGVVGESGPTGPAGPTLLYTETCTPSGANQLIYYNGTLCAGGFYLQTVTQYYSDGTNSCAASNTSGVALCAGYHAAKYSQWSCFVSGHVVYLTGTYAYLNSQCVAH